MKLPLNSLDKVKAGKPIPGATGRAMIKRGWASKIAPSRYVLTRVGWETRSHMADTEYALFRSVMKDD